MWRYGFSPTITEVREIIYDYLGNNIKNIACFKDSRSGKGWFKAFMKRNKPMKHAEIMCAACKKAIENPFMNFMKWSARLLKGRILQ